MSTTRNIKDGYTAVSSFSMSSASSSSSSSSQLPSSAHQHNYSDIHHHHHHHHPTWEPTSESPKDPQSLPPRMRLKEKKKPFGEFRIIREPAPSQDRTTELRPIPSPPWAKDSFSLDSSSSSHCLHDDTRGKDTSHARPSFPSNATAPPPLRYQESCTHTRNNSKSSVECSSTTSSFQALSISSPYAWTAPNRPSPPSSASTFSSPFSASTSTGSMVPVNSYPTSPHQPDDALSEAEPSQGITYQFRPHRIVTSRSRTAHSIVTHRPETELVHRLPDEDEGEGEREREREREMTMSTAVYKPLHSGMETNTFTPPARPSRKQKRYGCDICGQIFTRSGDVRRHKESRHDNSEGCRCPFCGRVLTRQDALQRHWDKYCRMRSKRHLDKQASEAQNRTMPSMPAPVYAPAAPPQTMGIGPGPDQMKYRYLNIFG